jgi:hypothetical protein
MDCERLVKTEAELIRNYLVGNQQHKESLNEELIYGAF